MIVLAVMTYNGAATEPVEASFDELGGTIDYGAVARVASEVVTGTEREASSTCTTLPLG